ncbi:hypothetical protein B7486_28180 [cyanobacterium TDX16]|nr:hypothetical protein B7486_28180 [cyanobacterium TDX16]
MLNVAFALNVFFVMLYLIAFKEMRWLSPGIFVSLVCVTYILLRFTPTRRYIQPNITVHLIFICAYAIPAIALCIATIAAMEGANGLGAAMFFFISFFPALFLLLIGILILMIGALRSTSKTKI